MKSNPYCVLLIVLALVLGAPASACSDFLLKTDNPKEVVSGRTIDFYYLDAMNPAFMVEGRGTQWTSVAALDPDTPGLSWKNTYGFVGIKTTLAETLGFPDPATPYYLDTLNEEGLSAAFLHNVGSTFPHTVANPKKGLLYLDLPAYIAGNFKTVDEAKRGIQDLEIWCPRELDGIYPTHLIVHDAQKKSMVVEWEKGPSGEPVMNIYDGEIVDSVNGVMTNDPGYPVQLAHLGIYTKNVTVENYFSGIPGSILTHHRFVRLALYNENNAPINLGPDTGMGTVSQAFSLLSTVEIVSGTQYLSVPVNGTPQQFPDYTLISLVRDQGDRAYYYKTAANQNLGKIDLKKLDFTSGKYREISIIRSPPEIPLYTDVTGDLQADPVSLKNPLFNLLPAGGLK